jgi:hypothetical protein
LEKILPQTFDKSLITERKGEVELKLDNDPYGLNFDLYNNDIEIILAYGKCLENLPKDRLPNSNDLPYSINRITEAIERLKNYKYIPENLRTIGIQAANFLELYKLGDKYVRDNNA